MNARTTPDMQMPENNSLANRDLWHWCRLWEWEQYERPTTNNISLTSSDKKDLQKIAQRLTEYCQENLSKKFIKRQAHYMRNVTSKNQVMATLENRLLPLMRKHHKILRGNTLKTC